MGNTPQNELPGCKPTEKMVAGLAGVVSEKVLTGLKCKRS